jgi:hypothetical protein
MKIRILCSCLHINEADINSVIYQDITEGIDKKVKGPAIYNLCDGIVRTCSQQVEIYISVYSRDTLMYGCNAR